VSADRATPDSDDLGPEETPTGVPVEAKLFLLFGAFSLLLAVVYFFTTRAYAVDGTEYSGAGVLLFASAFSFTFGIFLARSLRKVQIDVEEYEANEIRGSTDPDETLYLPTASIWPIGIGVGASLTLGGIALGLWVMIPGIVLLAHSVIGFAIQSRDRSG
jgi:hypothetical protein